jgi:hypothetical protein
MNAPLNRAKRPGVEDAESLARRLDAFASTLSPRERALLTAAMEHAMDPLDRMKARPPGEVLSEEELRLFAEVLADGDAGKERAGR